MALKRPPPDWSPYTRESFLALSYTAGSLEKVAVSYEAPIKFAVISNSQNMVYIKLKGNGYIKTGFLKTLKFLNK